MRCVASFERTPLTISSLVQAGNLDIDVHGQLVFTLGVRNRGLRPRPACLAMITLNTLDVYITAHDTKSSK
jgi:hypothetical protein